MGEFEDKDAEGAEVTQKTRKDFRNSFSILPLAFSAPSAQLLRLLRPVVLTRLQ
jgi:hypothetical protein